MNWLIKQALKIPHLHALTKKPRGHDLAFDLQSNLSVQKFLVVFDVGANTGQSTEKFLKIFPEAVIWSFEPGAKQYAELEEKFKRNARVITQNIGFSSAIVEAELVQTSLSTMSHIRRQTEVLPKGISAIESEIVQLTTVDGYSDKQGVFQIDFLKIDTEGHDLDVLIGSKTLLSAGRISCIQCECGLHPENKFHIPFEEIKKFLENYGYRLFGIYDQVGEWTTGMPHLRRADVVFVSPILLGVN